MHSSCIRPHAPYPRRIIQRMITWATALTPPNPCHAAHDHSGQHSHTAQPVSCSACLRGLTPKPHHAAHDPLGHHPSRIIQRMIPWAGDTTPPKPYYATHDHLGRESHTYTHQPTHLPSFGGHFSPYLPRLGLGFHPDPHSSGSLLTSPLISVTGSDSTSGLYLTFTQGHQGPSRPAAWTEGAFSQFGYLAL